MDKYTEYALNSIGFYIWKEAIKDENLLLQGKVTNPLAIRQANNYTIDNYYIAFIGDSIESITYDGKKYVPEKHDPIRVQCVLIPFSYSKKVKSFIVAFNGGLLEPASVKISYVDANKEAYDMQVRKELNKKINAAINTGWNLVNIYWDKVVPDVSKVQLKLYGVVQGNNVRGTERRIIDTYIEETKTFLSISGLAFGEYVVEIVELDISGNVIAQNEYKFKINNLCYTS